MFTDPLFMTQLAYFIALFPLGACIGSFLNVVIYRMPHEINLFREGSYCPHCNTAISFKYNIPIFGWLILKGKTACCNKKFSARYPAVELLTALLWGVVGWQLAAVDFASPYEKAGVMTLWLVVISLMIVISFIDIDYQIIPDELSIGGLILALIACVALPFLHPEFVFHFPAVNPRLAGLLGGATGAVAGAGIVLIVSLVGTIAYRKKIKELQKDDPDITTAIGFGDVKLMAFLGAVIGWKSILAAFFIGAIYGSVIGVFEKFRTGAGLSTKDATPLDSMLNRWRTGNSVLPFGPSLCLGGLTMLLYKQQILTFLADYFRPITLLF